jgi:hypothetical protein
LPSHGQPAIDCELSEIALAPYVDAVRDVFLEWRSSDGRQLSRVAEVKVAIDPQAFDGGRHFAGCRQDGRRVALAPELAHLPEETITAIVAHEMGHAVDFLYPAEWAVERGKPATWLSLAGDGRNERRARYKIMAAWSDREHDLVELAADSITWAIVGRRVQYCGPCLLECWRGGVARPTGLT